MSDLTREETLALLSSMGIALPATTSAALLSKRLDLALDAAQYFTQVFSILSQDPFVASGCGDNTEAIDFAPLPTWAGMSLDTSLGRRSINESLSLEDIEFEERERAMDNIPPNLDPIYALRSLVLVLGREVEKGSKEVKFEDAESGHALFIKALHTMEVDDDTPLLQPFAFLIAKPNILRPIFNPVEWEMRMHQKYVYDAY
ncbi:hypothetical protein FRC01_005398 [Tulasnella sp. 417]|nr:hypothetical protein FRC01_005398 [Tulasnella sp. 417]